MSASQAVFVLVHGGWHNHSAWHKVTPILEAGGLTAFTLDLPGAGVNSIAPMSLCLRPFDPAAFAAEPSPLAGVTQEQRTRAVVELVKEAAASGGGPRMRPRNCIATNRMPAPWPRRKLRPHGLAKSRAITSAAPRITPFRWRARIT
jgi:hypothetical protein